MFDSWPTSNLIGEEHGLANQKEDGRENMLLASAKYSGGVLGYK